MMICGLLGKVLGHSYSPMIHRYLGDYSFELFEKQPEELVDFLKNGNFTGLNVTMPYKKDVIPYLDELSPIAARLGAVNTIVRRNGKLTGHNTDYAGFSSMVSRSGLDPAGKKVLILGSGGASATAVAVMEDLGANVVVISRNGVNNYNNLHLHSDTEIIVNTTPVGMYPNTEGVPIDIRLFPQLEGVLDVIYNPINTKLIQHCELNGVYGMSGLWMLVAQAKEASEWFQNTPICDDKITEIYHFIKAAVENIVLIGMPGCGKTTIGKALAEKLGRKFVDTDEAIAEKAGMTIPEILEKYGEKELRAIETQVLSHLGKQSGLVIATGGGCVTIPENYGFLHQNGRIFLIKRDISKLPTDGRPLSKAGMLEEMYRIRKPLYESFADIIIENETVEQSVQRIMEAIE